MNVGDFLRELEERREAAAEHLSDLCIRSARKRAKRVDLDPEELSQEVLLRIFENDVHRLRSMNAEANLEGVVHGFVWIQVLNPLSSWRRRCA